jgi:hypothetical protein
MTTCDLIDCETKMATLPGLNICSRHPCVRKFFRAYVGLKDALLFDEMGLSGQSLMGKWHDDVDGLIRLTRFHTNLLRIVRDPEKKEPIRAEYEWARTLIANRSGMFPLTGKCHVENCKADATTVVGNYSMCATHGPTFAQRRDAYSDSEKDYIKVTTDRKRNIVNGKSVTRESLIVERMLLKKVQRERREWIYEISPEARASAQIKRLAELANAADEIEQLLRHTPLTVARALTVTERWRNAMVLAGHSNSY